jgi:drug/metabolite transporter (DMT)-like permease
LFWSGNFIVGRYIKDDISPLELAFFRWFFVSMFVFPYFVLHFKNIINTFKKHFKMLIFLSFLGITLFNTILYIGLSATHATNALIINSIVPLLILFLSYIILKQPISLYQTIGIIISTFGVLFLVLKGELSSIVMLEFNSGDIWIVVAAFTWALYSVMVKFKPKELNDFEYFTTIVLIGFLILSTVYFLSDFTPNRFATVLQENYPVFFYVSIFASLLSFYFWHNGINKIGASKTGQFTHLMPIFGSILAYIFLGEVLYYYHIVGMVLIAVGIYLSLFFKKDCNFRL